MENHDTHLAPGFTFNDLVPAPANVVVLPGPLGPCLWGTHTASTRCPPSRGTASPMWPEEPRTPLCCWGFTLLTRYGAVEFQTLHSVCLPSEWNLNPLLSPFSLFSPVTVAVSNFPLSLQLLLGRGAFPIFSPPSLCLQPLSTDKSGSLPSAASLSPSSPLHAVYLLNSMVQVVQIVVLILRSVF